MEQNVNSSINIKNNKYKKGITLVVLVVTIVVGLILVSAGIVAVSTSISDAKKVAFAEELKQIEDQVSVYYLQNGEVYPAYTNDDGTLITKTPSEIKSVIGEKKFNILKEEMKSNKENGEEEITEATQLAFYAIDLNKLDLDKKTRGIKKDNSEEDVYVISAKTGRAYYLKGVKAGGETYFSLSNKILNYLGKVESTTTEGDVIVKEVGALTVKRVKKTWTNQMGINLSVKDTTGTISATLKDGNNVIATSNFTLKSEYTLNTPLDIPGSSFNVTNIINFSNSNNKVIEFTKGTDTLAVDLANYDVYDPEVGLSNITKNVLETENVITFKVRDTQSGIKEVKYDYLTKYDENGEVQNYYKDTDNLDPSFIKARGKKAKISSPDNDGYVTVTIKLPFNIEGIQLYISDKAGNYAKDSNGNPVTIGVYDFDNDPYIGCELQSITNQGLTFKVIINTKINKFTVNVKADDEDYIDLAYSYNSLNIVNNYAEVVTAFKDKLAISKKAYVKITVPLSPDQIRVFEFDIDNMKDEKEENTPVVPNGFVASSVVGEKDIEGGFVIYEGTEPVTNENVDEARTTRNQFVWVPVEDINEFVREEGYFNNAIQDVLKNCTEPYTSAIQSEKDEYEAMKTSVEKYNGFYIARYEASYNRTTKKSQSVANQVPTTKVKWGTSMTDLSGGAVEKARAVFPVADATNEKDPVSTLCYGVEWDQTIRFLNINYPDINKINRGNFTGSEIIDTGSDENCKFNNIYDMGENINEWTMEAGVGSNISGSYDGRVTRGGYYGDERYMVSYRKVEKVTTTSTATGFRIALYMK